MNEGARQLAALGLSLREIAREIGVTKQAVSDWRSGRRKPTEGFRRLLETKFGIPAAAWSKPAGGTASTTQPAPAPAANTNAAPVEAPSSSVAPDGAAAVEDGGPPGDRLDHLNEVLRSIWDARKRAAGAELAKLTSAEGALIERLARLEQAKRAEAALLEARIVREHPSWLRLLDAIDAALKPYPDAARAVLGAVKLLEAS